MPGPEKNELYECECTNAQYDKLPHLEITIKSDSDETFTHVLSFNKQSYLVRNLFSKNQLLILPNDMGVAGGLPGEQYWRLGTNFLREHYTILDLEKQ